MPFGQLINAQEVEVVVDGPRDVNRVQRHHSSAHLRRHDSRRGVTKGGAAKTPDA
jgi:hypothetical protein